MFGTILDFILRTNLFNFIIFAGIIIYLYCRLDVTGSLEAECEKIAEHIEDSKTAKEDSVTNLTTVEEMVAHLEDEVDEIIRKSEDNAHVVGDKIITDANKNVNNIKNNVVKLAENKAALLKNDIIKRASIASVEVAKNHIINELNNNYDLHNKLIDESIEAINGVDL